VIEDWLKANEDNNKIKPVTVLIGGWAVYSYNPWYGSIDIDLVTNSSIKNDLMCYLIEKQQYGRGQKRRAKLRRSNM